MAKLTKADLINAIHASTPLSKSQAEVAINKVLELIQSAVEDGDKVELRGFGAFSRKDRAARTGRNPKTGETITIPASTAMHFKPSKAA